MRGILFVLHVDGHNAEALSDSTDPARRCGSVPVFPTASPRSSIRHSGTALSLFRSISSASRPRRVSSYPCAFRVTSASSTPFHVALFASTLSTPDALMPVRDAKSITTTHENHPRYAETRRNCRLLNLSARKKIN
jgi:hypothetical protein